MEAIVQPVKDISSDNSQTEFVVCPENEAEYFALYIRHNAGHVVWIEDFKSKEIALQWAERINFAIKP